MMDASIGVHIFLRASRCLPRVCASSLPGSRVIWGISCPTNLLWHIVATVKTVQRIASSPATFTSRSSPSCFRKKGTSDATHWSLIPLAHSNSIGRAQRPLSPPTLTHFSVPSSSQGDRSTHSSRGSADTKRTGAGRRPSTVRRGAYLELSTDVPIHTLAGQASNRSAPSCSHQPTARPGRLVSTWNTWPLLGQMLLA